MALSKFTASRSEGKFAKLARTFSRNRKIQVRLAGNGCYTDNEKLINLPANADWLSDETQHLLDGCLDHETGHCERQQFGLDERVRGNKIDGKPFPLYTEEVKKFRTSKERNLLNVFEDIALEINASRKYVGMADNLRELNATLTTRISKEAHRLSPWKALTCAMIARARKFDTSWVPAKVLPLLDALQPVIERSMVETYHVGQSVLRVQETMAIIKKFAEEQPEEKDDHEAGDSDDKDDAGDTGEDEPKGESKGEEQDAGDDAAVDEEHGGGDQGEEEGEEEEGNEESSGKGEEQEEQDEEGEESAGGEAGEDEKGEEEGEEDDAQDDSKAESATEPTKGIPEDTREFAKELDEGDSDMEHVTDEINKDIERESKRDMLTSKRHYPHPDVLALDEVKKITGTTSTDIDSYNSDLNDVRPVIAGLRSRLMLYLRAQKQDAIQGDKERGHIDDQALYGLRTGDKRVFYERTETEEVNTVIGILVDQSGSMQGEGKIEMARKSCIAVSETLDKLHITFAVWGFNNLRDLYGVPDEDKKMYNRFRSLDIKVYKEFEENFSRCRPRYAHMTAKGDNSDGEAVQYVVDQLRRRPEQRKILLVLSDGNPLCGSVDYNALRVHLKETVQLAAKSGVETFGLGIMDNAVTYFYQDNATIKHIGELPKAMFQMLRKYLMRPVRARAV